MTIVNKDVPQFCYEDSLPGYSPMIFVNRPVWIRMPGGEGAGGKKSPAIRLNFLLDY